MSLLSRLSLPLSIFVASSGLLVAQSEMVCDPVGFNKIPCPTNSDTIVGVPLRAKGSQKATLSALPDTTTLPGSAILSVAGSPGWTVDAYAGTHYVKFTSGAKDGAFYAVTANSADTLTVDLNGDDVSTVLATDTILLAEYWTLDTLFPPADATTSWGAAPDYAPDGHAIVTSTSTSALTRKTQILLPATTSSGINLAPNLICYILSSSEWRIGTGTLPSDAATPGDIKLQPDTYFIIRHPASVSYATVYVALGEVEMGNVAIPLSTLTAGPQDNFIAILRPINTRLDALNLGGTTAFVTSLGTSALQRRDQLLVFDNTVAARNKSPSAIYCYYGGNWRNATGGAISDAVVIPGGAGFIIRKYKTSDGATVFWTNPPTYTNL